ncbi:phytanoyl-CoA dioxygenase family protein [Tateyamaria omphalii]|uniref:phytanoyl-CoA dioxygenase family protein n=1 Tax=Tateyamaria omphalii TaxID=299262 RepID=UPI00167B36F5|nr:phytanoyl-CoA dioxygenase family protein [Tateyamaria omphalii]
MSENEAADLYDQLLLAEQSCGGRLPAVLNAKAHLLLPFLWDLVHDPRIVDPVRAVLGPDVLCWGSSFFSKDPGSSDHVPLHQDSTVWGLSEHAGLTVWLALTPSTEETGCLQVVPGTHRTTIQHVIRDSGSSMLPFGEEVALDYDLNDRLSCPLAPGEMSMHHALLVHGSHTNSSDSLRRVGFAIRYIPGHVHQIGDDKMYATLVCGENHGTAHKEVRPEASMAPDALARHRRILAAATRVVSKNARGLPRE